MRATELLDRENNIKMLLTKHFNISAVFNTPVSIDIHSDGSVSVDGNVVLISSITQLPVRFRKVGGFFNCKYANLTSLEGSPQEVGGFFSCYHTKISSLIGGPKKVGNSFSCSQTKITSLEGAPEFVGGYFDCEHTQITSLIGGPEKVGGYYNCMHTPITNLVGCPYEIPESLHCSLTKLSSIEGMPKKLGGDIFWDNTPFESLIENDENTQISSLRINPQLIFHILTCPKPKRMHQIKLSQTVLLVAIDTDPTLISQIRSPSRILQLTAVKRNPKVFQNIQHPDPLVVQYMIKYHNDLLNNNI